MHVTISLFPQRELRKAKLYDNHNVKQSQSQSASGVLPGVTTGLGKYEGLCGKAGTSINSINGISLSSSTQCSGFVVVLWLLNVGRGAQHPILRSTG